MADNMKKDKAKILYVDDEVINLKSFELSFEDEYTVLTSSNPIKAIEILKNENEISIIITDQRMSGMSGTDFLEHCIELYPDSVRILLSAYTDKEDMLNAINTGKVYNYIVKPWTEADVREILSKALEKYYLVKENKRLVEELKQKIQLLETTQEKLIQQEKKSIVIDLSRGLYHEIKNQLNPISMLELLKHEVSDDSKQFIDYIIDSKDRIIGLIDEVRYLVKGEDVNYEIQEMNIAEVINEAVILYKMNNENNRESIELDLKYSGMAKLNKNKIIQVLLNLINNAQYAISNQKKGKIVIKTEQENNFVKIYIIDNGSGIEQEKLDKIWDPFYTTKGILGTGIGLDICKRIITGHNGTISCQSELEVGSTFMFTLEIP